MKRKKEGKRNEWMMGEGFIAGSLRQGRQAKGTEENTRSKE
jgi:hypothetical protein